VQITIWLGRKTRNNLLVFSRAQILRDDVANEVGRSLCFSRHRKAQSIGERVDRQLEHGMVGPGSARVPRAGERVSRTRTLP
jgi:hypothetical protein